MNQQTVYFAKENFRGNDRTFGIRTDDRRQHMYVIGRTGTGKSNLLKSLALQDMKNGEGLAIVDPHGGFIEEVLSQIPENRISDVIYFNPVDTEYPIGFNVFEVPDPKFKHLVASDLLGIFTKIWANVWSDRMEYILNNCILALLDAPGTTLLGIPRILVEKDYRKYVLSYVKDPVVRSFWFNEYETWPDRYRQEAIAAVINKVGQFLSSSIVRNVIGQPKSAFNVFDMMNQRKILLVNVSKGRVGEDSAALLGAMFITKIQLAAMERVRIPANERKDFYLYVDEFQNFATDSFSSILSEARKYRLNLIIAHQYIGQLVTENSTRVRDAVFGNVGTMIVFRVGATDAEFLENEFTPEFEIQDLVNLPNYHTYLKLMVNGVASRPFSAVTIFAENLEQDQDSTEAVIKYTREHYARPVKEVEDEIENWARTISDSPGPVPATTPTRAPTSSRASEKPLKEERYTASCSVCGEPAHVNFKPDEKRPIYCSQCLKKVQAGEIEPIKIAAPSPVPPAVVIHKPVVPVISAGAPIVKNLGEKTLSLKDLAKPPLRRAPDIAGLKGALRAALGPQNAPSSALKPGEIAKL